MHLWRKLKPNSSNHISLRLKGPKVGTLSTRIPKKDRYFKHYESNTRKTEVGVVQNNRT